VTNSHDLERYNTVAVIDAFEKAFGPGEDVALAIKDYGASSGDESLRQILARRRDNRIEYLSAFSEKRELIRLYQSCDAFVSAHRGEGFGMKILDAMACGLPVVLPLFGGPTAYCRPGNCFPVDFALIPMGDCLDSQSLHIGNGPLWAGIVPDSLQTQMRRLYEDQAAARTIGANARAEVLDRFSWERAAERLVEITARLRAERPATTTRPKPANASPAIVPSPYWLGLRVSVVVPTHNRKDKLLACLEALSRQSVLPQEFEVVVIDDGSTDGTREALEHQQHPFALRYFWQQGGGPGAARNLGIEHATGELVLFIGDDILADERLLEEHLLAHATDPDPGLAILGHIDWPASMTPNAVMDCVCGEAKLQFAYADIPKLPALDHRFFYTSNISLKRQFLVDAASNGIRFDPCFRRAAFEDSEFAFRLLPRGLRIRYAEQARAAHDHWMDLDSFAQREFGAGEMAVVFYRKHPGQDALLKVRWIADSVKPALALLEQPQFLSHLDAFDRQTDTMLRALAGALEELLALDGRPGSSTVVSLSADRLRAALNNLLRAIFDVERTRGKLQEWYSTVDDPAKVRAAQTLASVMRKLEFLGGDHPVGLQGLVAPLDPRVVADLNGRLAKIPGVPVPEGLRHPVRARVRTLIRRHLATPAVLSRVIAADRFVEAKLQSARRAAWLTRYRSLRNKLRQGLI
jgi:glycosyltransferase involved in cell wall biosynthesis